MKIQMSLALALLLQASLLTAAERANWYPCYRVEHSPQIDGEVANDPAWQGVPRVTGFHVLGNGYARAKQSTAMMCWDGDAVCIAVVCEEPDAASLKSDIKDGGWTWARTASSCSSSPRTAARPTRSG